MGNQTELELGNGSSSTGDQELTAAAPGYLFFWLFLCVGPILYILSFIQSFWESKIPAFMVKHTNNRKKSINIFFLHNLQAFMFAPLFLVSLGAVVLIDGLGIYAFFTEDINISISDSRAQGNDILEEEKYIPIEFAGAVASAVFYVSSW